MTPSVQTFHQSIGKQLVARDPCASQVLGTVITFKEIRSFPIVLSIFSKANFLPFHSKARASEQPKNTKNYYLDPQMQLSFTNLVSTDAFIPVQAEQRVALHMPEQRPSFQG